MKSNVYFIDLRATPKESLVAKLVRLMNTAGLSETIKKRDLVAVKLHFGERGNTAFIRPVFLRKIVETVKGIGAVPFLTDANTLYAGTRSDAPHHLVTAIQNGFAYAVVDAPIIIADGIRGKNEIAVAVNQKHCKKVYIGSDIVEADALISVAHFKGHELSGFGGTIKNLGMGCASRRGKLEQHSTVAPKVNRKKCVGCGDCVSQCSQKALSLEKEKAVINTKKCIGCGECILICPEGAIEIQWNQAVPIFLEKMVEYTMGVLKNKAGKTLHLNFITDVSPACDCYGHNDAAIVRDIGILAAKDPVAIDQASVDLVNQEQALPDSCLQTNTQRGGDKFRGVYPEIDWPIQLDYAEKIGLGSRSYELVKI
ncbi:MAG: DUF362 domain-containing protein [Pseudomonadota bacterium]|uniref:DUF362 domain-containing protein n=1 Tax=Candidatus Desulfatibia profunda TaxID=2841695 RepID=A0A8J6NQ90_9BACT|nr:DUF362 domain-containing protein [Candidatus Desulfatibia profunda]MBL7180636.1 DUF362 domain-containing protein [Desulfobacterales bacterium]MBU0698369.1 DUF362 domain-containing protein [Pseudomonadota bacterium]